jgi:hypothetical protein
VFVEDNESEERLVNRFRREVMRTGVIQECKRRRYLRINKMRRNVGLVMLLSVIRKGNISVLKPRLGIDD